MKSLDEYSTYPSHVFPKPVEIFIENFSKGSGSQPSYVGISVLALSSVLFEKASLIVKPGYVEYPNFYLGIIGNPGVTKTASVKMAMKPLNNIEKEADFKYRQERKVYKEALRNWQDQPPKGRGKPPTPPPAPIRRVISDGSIEAMIVQMDAQYEMGEKPHMAFVKEELRGFFGGMNKWKASGSGDDYEMFLQLFSGHDISKVLKSEQYFIPDARCTVIGGIQPDVYREAMKDKGDGMVDRFLVAFYDGEPIKTSLRDTVSEDVIDNYMKFWDKLIDVPAIKYRFAGDDVIDAVDEFHDWCHRIGGAYDLGAFKKWEQNFYKICIVLAVMWNKVDMDMETVERAKELAGYMTHDWLKSRLSAETDPKYKDAEKVFKNIDKYGKRSLDSICTSVRCVRNHSESTQYLIKLLQILMSKGTVEFNDKEAWIV